MRGVFLLAMWMGASALAAPAESALDALMRLPEGQAAQVAKIEARDAGANPDRWYFLVYDPASSTGVHEFVVEDRKVTASREVSQFADSLTPGDVLGIVKTNSDAAAKLAAAYAEASGIKAAPMNFELKKTADGPTWKVWCVDAMGTPMSTVVISAADGRVLTHDGVPVAPEATPIAAATQPAPGDTRRPAPAAAPAAAASRRAARRSAAAPAPSASPQDNVLKKTGRTLHRFFPF